MMENKKIEITPKLLDEFGNYIGKDPRGGFKIYQLEGSMYKIIKGKVIKMPGSDGMMSYNNH